jgi:hypothetical protein
LNIPHFEITAKTGISKAQIYKLREKAISRGWDPKTLGIVVVHRVEDAPRSKTSQNTKAVAKSNLTKFGTSN